MGELRLISQEDPLAGDLDADISEGAGFLLGGAFAGDPERAQGATVTSSEMDREESALGVTPLVTEFSC